MLENCVRRERRRPNVAELHGLDDRSLRDIGISALEPFQTNVDNGASDAIGDVCRSSTNLRASHRLSWICVCFVVGVVVGDVAAGQRDPPYLDEASEIGPLLDQEPITPVPSPPAADPLKLALGERLFTDPRLSANGTLTCASCHDIHANGAGRGPRKAALDGSKSIDTLTVFNAALSFRLNWEGNYRTLDAQAESSLERSGFQADTSVDEVRPEAQR